MSKERLEEYHSELLEASTIYDTNIELEDVEWLIEQAELAQEWESIARTQHDAKLEIESHCLELDAQNKRYREALRFYANPSNYVTGTSIPNVNVDGGRKAMNALEGESE